MTTVWQRHRPDLLFAHFLCADSFQHLYGPRSAEAYWAIEYIDDRIRRFLDTLPAGALDRDTAVFVVSDHGFLPSTKEIRLNVWLRQRGLLTVGADGAITRAAARVVMNHGGAYLYVLEGDRQAIAADLAREIAKLEGVAGAWTESQYKALGIPTPSENPFVGEVALEAAPGYCYGDTASGDALLGPPKYRGTHGQRPEHDENHAFFLATGPGIRRGTTLAPIVSRDVAPTLGQWLGIAMPDVDRAPLADIFG
jgi:predicted AlkP superfamily pyrophosphatase or phosphodiesterase